MVTHGCAGAAREQHAQRSQDGNQISGWMHFLDRTVELVDQGSTPRLAQAPNPDRQRLETPLIA